MHLLILASGRGSRLKKATSKHPKCFVKVKQKKIIDHIAENFYKFEDIIIATGYKSSLLKKNFLEQNLHITNIILLLIWFIPCFAHQT